MGEWREMHHGENWEDFVMIMMLLLVSIIIYYYMNAFITLHQCTFNEVKIATLGDVKGPTVKLALLSLCP